MSQVKANMSRQNPSGSKRARIPDIEGGEADAAFSNEESHEDAITFVSIAVDRDEGDTPSRSSVGRG